MYFRQFFVSVLSWSLFLQTLAPVAHASTAEAPYFPDMTAFLNSQEIQDPQFLDFVKGQEKLLMALEERKVESIPKHLIDPHHIVGQSVYDVAENKEYFLDNLGNDIPRHGVDEIKVSEGPDGILIEGIQNEMTVIRHKIRGLTPIAEVRDKEFLIFMNKDGSLYAIDVHHLVRGVFQHIIPVFKIYDNKQSKAPIHFEKGKTYKLTFLTRGLKPFVENEVSKVTDKKRLIPEDMSGKPLFNAGDLLVMENGKTRSLKAVLNRDVIRSILVTGSIELTISAYLASHEGHGRTLGEKVNNLLGIGGAQDKRPIDELLELVQENKIKEVPFQLDKIQPDLRTLLRNSLQSFDRPQLKEMVKQVKMLKAAQSSPRDQFSLEQWYESFNRIVKQAALEKEASDVRVATEEGIDAEEFVQRSESLRKEIFDQNFINNYQALLGADFKKTVFSKKEVEDSFWKKIPYKKLGILAGKISASGLALWGGYEAVSLTENSFAIQINMILNYINDQFVFHQLGTHPAYLKPLLCGTISLLLFIPLAYLYGQVSVAIMYRVSKVLEKFKGAESYLPKIAAALSYKLDKASQHFKDKDFTQRFVTYATKPYAFLVYPIYNRILNMMRQPTMRSLAFEVNPFTKITPDSHVGEKINMKEDDPAFRVGFNSPFVSNGKLKELREKQNAALSEIVRENRLAKDMAFNLATFVVSHDRNIDPAILSLLIKGKLNLDSMKEIETDSRLRDKWMYAASGIYVDLLDVVKNPHLSIDELDEEVLKDVYKKAISYADHIENNKVLSQIAVKWRNFFLLGAKKSGAFFANLAKEDHQKLTSMTASKFVGRQTWTEFWQDHIIVSLLTAIFGKRANLAASPDIWAHGNDHFLWTTAAHGTDVAQNTYAHLFAAGPKRMLVYQSLKVEIESNYAPIENVLLNNKTRVEDFGQGIKNWSKEVFNPFKSNLGAYYTQDFLKRLTTLQAGFIMMIFFRVLVGGQSLEESFMAWLMFIGGGMIYFGWPWDVISRGNQMEDSRIEDQLEKLKELQNKIYRSLRENNDDVLLDSYLELSQFYKGKQSQIQNQVQEILTSGQELISSLPSLKDKMLKAIMKENKAPIILGYLMSMKDKVKKGNAEDLQILMNDLDGILERKMSNEEIQEAVKKMNVKKMGEELVNMSLKNPPIPTNPNHYISLITTFVVGAIGTTALSIPLSVDTFDKSLLNFEHIGKLWGYYFVFMGATFALMSKNGAEAIRDKIAIPIHKVFIAPVKNYSKRTCTDIMRSIFLSKPRT